MKKKMKLTPLEKSWILYDIGNSAFTLLVSTLIPIYFNALAGSAGINEDMYLSYWGYAGSISTILVAIIAPLCGTMSDRKIKKPIFLLTVILGCVACVALGLTTHWLFFLGIFVLAKVGFHSSIVFYDSMLPEVTTEERMDNVSSLGYAFGYIGSVIPFVICLVLVLMCDKFGMTMGQAMTVAFLVTAVWWAIFSMPLLKKYKQTAFVDGKGAPLMDSFKQLARTFKEAKAEKEKTKQARKKVEALKQTIDSQPQKQKSTTPANNNASKVLKDFSELKMLTKNPTKVIQQTPHHTYTTSTIAQQMRQKKWRILLKKG